MYYLTKQKVYCTYVHIKILVDTSVILAVAMNEPEKDTLVAATNGHTLAAPPVLPYEIGNALSAMFRRKRIDKDEVIGIWRAIGEIPVELVSSDIENSLLMSTEFGNYAYDSYFIQCAIEHRLHLLSLDRRLNEIARELGVHILEL